ncbi:MAG: saccharopine dehydrogenase NADP-binding domain-containing protein [Caldilineales bacterium]|nr:saccharopine dehydrogenase NADP-binding domain-containing protein [Caldilineales bacterium]
MRALVLGAAGAVCRETTRDLAAFSSFDEIVLADYNQKALTALVQEIGDERLQPISFDASDYAGMVRLFPNFDIVINGLPFKFDLPVNRACVEVGVNGLDLSSEDAQFALHDEALAKGMTFIPGVGATPGITNMMVRRASELLDAMHEVEVFFAAFRCLAPAPGLLATTLWEFNPEEEGRAEVYFADGAWHATGPMTGEIAVRFHEHIGEQLVYYVPHDESNTLPQSYPGLRRAAVRGCFPPHVMALMSALMRGGLLTGRKVHVGENEMPAIEAVADLLASSPVSRQNPVWAYGLVVEVTGKRAGRKVVCKYRNHHPAQEVWGGESAYFKNVGIPLSIGAQLIASGQATARGVVPPEQALPAGPFFTELARRSITVEETIVETGEKICSNLGLRTSNIQPITCNVQPRNME